MHLLSQNLRMELAGSGVRHTEICPGRVATEFFDTAIDDEERRTGMRESCRHLDPEDIADAILYAIGTLWHVNVSTIELTPTEQAPGGVVIEKARRGTACGAHRDPNERAYGARVSAMRSAFRSKV